MESKEIKVTLPGNIAAWFEYQRGRENRTMSAMALHCITVYSGQKVGKNRLTVPPENGIIDQMEDDGK